MGSEHEWLAVTVRIVMAMTLVGLMGFFVYGWIAAVRYDSIGREKRRDY